MNDYSRRGNPRQQPTERHYHRERDRYFDEELRDVYEGADYNEQARYGSPEDFTPHDYYDDNYRFTPYNRQRSYSDYTPASDFGYERDEYYPMDPSHHHYRRSQATGYGNDGSLQARDFEDWRDTSGRHRNRDTGDYRSYYFPAYREDDHNRDFEEGMYDYRREHQYQERGLRRAQAPINSYRSGHNGNWDPEERRLHNRSNRHPEIVTPFKEDRHYSRNDYNNSVGFGSNEMVFHEED